MTNDGRIFLKPGNAEDRKGRYYDKSDFPTLFLDGLSCDSTSGKCQIQNVDTRGGEMGGKYECPKPFVDVWMKRYPRYVSPYSGSTRRSLEENDGREL